MVCKSLTYLTFSHIPSCVYIYLIVEKPESNLCTDTSALEPNYNNILLNRFMKPLFNKNLTSSYTK